MCGDLIFGLTLCAIVDILSSSMDVSNEEDGSEGKM